MTSRRSRLKAVTNLPVRRKVLTVQGNGKDNIAAENLASENTFSCHPKSDEVLATAFGSHTNQLTENNLNEVATENEGNDAPVNVNVTNFQSNENIASESNTSQMREPNNLEILESCKDLTKTCNLLSCKADNNNSSLYKDDSYFKLNSVSSAIGEKPQMPILEKNKGNEILLQNCSTINFNCGNSSTITISNNIVEDGFKCYTVLTPQNVTLSPLTEFTIAPLAPCENNYMDASVNDMNISEEFQEVQIYTETEPVELFISNEIDDNSESIIESEPLEPVLTSLMNFNNDPEVNCVNSDTTELKNKSENSAVKSLKKNTNDKVNCSENDKQPRNLISQIKDSNILERTISSNTVKVSPDFHSYKQISTIKRKRVKYNDYTKKLADAKKEFQRKYEKSKPDRSSLKMIDLIFYNPSSNPMESKSKLDKKDSLEHSSDFVNDLLAEEKVDEPDIVDSNSKSVTSDYGDSESTKMPVPQVKIGLDGEIILDEKSLIIETTDAKKGREGLQNSVPVLADKEYKVSYYRGKNKKTRDWADFETKRFYKALNTIGPDFTLMQKYFPKRSRLELKNKFKREERLNRALIDKALNNPSEFDMTQLEKDLAIEKEAEEGIEMRFRGIIKQTTRKRRVKSSFLSREMIELDGEQEKSQTKSFELDSKRLSENEKRKKEKEFDFVFHKLLMKESKRSGTLLPDISSSLNTCISSNQDVT